MVNDSELVARCRKIRLLLLDVDGVLSDGRLYYAEGVTEIKAFNTLDGHGIKMLQSCGVRVGIITGRSSEQVARRSKDLGISLLLQGREDKFAALQELLKDEHMSLDEIAFMGDDWPDLLVMTRVGLAMTVPNAHTEVRQRAHWISAIPGGSGAVREACDVIMRAQGRYEAALAPYLNLKP